MKMELDTAPIEQPGQSPSPPETAGQTKTLLNGRFPAAAGMGQCASD